jgi:hypothetical protein
VGSIAGSSVAGAAGTGRTLASVGASSRFFALFGWGFSDTGGSTVSSAAGSAAAALVLRPGFRSVATLTRSATSTDVTSPVVENHSRIDSARPAEIAAM